MDEVNKIIDRVIGRNKTDEISEKEVVAMKKKLNQPKQLLMELTGGEKKRVGKTSRVLRQMDGDTLSQRLDSYKKTIMLHISAALNNNSSVVKQLKNRQDPDAKDDCGRSALHFACRYGSDHIVYTLIREEATIDDQDLLMKWTPLHYAAYGGHKKVVTMLLQNVAKPVITANRKDSSGTTPLMIACAEGHMRVAEVLIFEGADVHEVDNDGWTALHYSAFHDQASTAELLIDFGADVSAKAEISHETPLEMAERLKKTRVALMLYDFS